MKTKTKKKRDQKIIFLFLYLFLLTIVPIQNQQNLELIECPEDKPVYKKLTKTCVLEYCTEEEYSNQICIITNPIIKKQFLGDFLYTSENGNPIYSSFGRNAEGDIFLESSLGIPYSQKKIYTLKNDGREYLDGVRINTINMNSNLYSKNGIGAIVNINNHKCYLKLSNNEAIEFYDFDDKKYTSTKLEDIFGFKVQSIKNSLLITKLENTFIYAYITTGNYLIMQKFKVISNDASNCIQLIKTLKEDVKTIAKDSRRCMITAKQYIECLDMDENQIYVIRVYDSELKFLKQYDLEKNNAPLEKAIYSFHEIVWLKEEISICTYYIDTSDNNAKPILVLKNLSIKNNIVNLNNLNDFLKRDVVFKNLQYKLSDTENSLAIYNSYYFGLTTITETTNRNLIIALFDIFNDDKTIDTHYFYMPLKDLYNIEYHSGIQAFGFKNTYGVQMNYIQNGENRSGFIVFGYANSTDPEPINRLFDKYDSYTIKIKDYYKGIENNLFCYVFVKIEVMEIPNSKYFVVKTKSGKTIQKGSSLTLDDELTITKKSSINSIPKGRYVLKIAPFLNEADYAGFIECSIDSDMFGQQVPTEWWPDEYYGRTIEFKFTVDIDCYQNCDTCTNKGLSIDDQQCDTCKNGYYFVENTKNCFGEPPDGYYFRNDIKIYSKCYDNCKACSTINDGDNQNCLLCKDNYLLYKYTNCLDCKFKNKYVNFEQTKCIDSIPSGYKVNDTEYNTIDKLHCHKNCLTCNEESNDDEDMKCLTCDNANEFYLIENTNNCKNGVSPGEYLDENILKKCHKNCLTCNEGSSDDKDMKCLSCDNANEFYLIENTNNCKNGVSPGEYLDENILKKCHKNCLTCNEGSSDDKDMKCLSCDYANEFYLIENTNNCKNGISPGEYLDENILKRCHDSCSECSSSPITNEFGEVTNCDSCNKDNGFYPVENSTICINKTKEGFYFDEEYQSYNKCNNNCLTCSDKEIDEQHMNCLSCDSSKGYVYYNNTKNCLNCLSLSQIVNEDQTGCIEYKLESQNIENPSDKIDICHKNCLTCNENSSDDEDMKCISCNNSNNYYFIENTNNCQQNPYPGYYLDNNILKSCYKDCLTCSGDPVTNNKGIIINMNCLSCNESKGYYFNPDTNNCDNTNLIHDDNTCPKDKPILKNGICTLEYCSEREYENKNCIISNDIIKTQWIGDFPHDSNQCHLLYSTFGQLSDEAIIFESNTANPFTKRNIYYFDENWRGFIEGKPSEIIDLKSFYFSAYGNGAIVKINGHKCYLRLSYYETIEMYDFVEQKYTSTILENILGYKIESYKNSLLRTNEENTFIFAYITRGNYLIMQKFKVVTNDAKNCIEIIKTSLESIKTINKNSRRCTITKNQFIECIDLDENQMYVIRLYDKDLNFLKSYELEKNKAPTDRAFYTYHEAVLLKGEISIFIYFNDISDKYAKPKILLKRLILKNYNNMELVDLSSYLSNEQIRIYDNIPYFISDSENSLSIINENYFALASLTSYDRHLLIVLFNIYNDDNTIYTHYYDIPIKQLYNIDYYGNLKSFGYRNIYGIQFDYKKYNDYYSGFIIFGFGNTTDPEPISDLFEKKESYIYKPSDYINIENNVFCYDLENIIITDLPSNSSGIIVLKVSNSQKLKVGDILSLNDEIKITHIDNKEDIQKGKYIIGFKPYIKEPDFDKITKCAIDVEIFGKKTTQVRKTEDFYGRKSILELTFGECFDNCETCNVKGNNLDEQKCETCIDKFYLVEGTQNCFEYPPEGYYLNEEKKIFSKCYDKCKTCSSLNVGKTQNCINCKKTYLLYKDKNCLDCKYRNKYVNYDQNDCIDYIPNRYYINDTSKNTIDKCHRNCLTCNEGSSNDEDMKCLTCDNVNGFYLLENTNNCEKYPYPGYYLDDKILKKCHISCTTCSEKPIQNENGEVTNCDSCNKELGFYLIDNSTICKNISKPGEYYDEECKCYKKCYENCLTCSGKEIDEYHMNCLTCDISEGFVYYSKTKNCLNCKSQSKFVNIEETKCIDKMLDDSELNNESLPCEYPCHTCNYETAPKNSMGCETCSSGYYLKNGNCIKTYICPYKYFYQIKIDKSVDINQKICLERNEICPCALPFYYTNTNECVETCPLELLFNQGCKISYIPNGLNKIILLIKLYFSEGIIDRLSKSFSLSDVDNIYNYIVQLSVYSLLSSIKIFRNLEMINNTYPSLTNDNISLFINDEKSMMGSDIDLGPCEKKLRDYYNIPYYIKLTIIKLDFRKNDSTVNNIQYEVFNPMNRTERLDLNICNEEKVIVKNRIDSSINLKRISYMMDKNKNTINIFSENNKFFEDECSIFTSEYGTDVLLQDRNIEYNYKNNLCQNSCELQNINLTTEEAYCSCEPKKGFVNISITNIEEIMKENDIMDDFNDYSNENQKFSSVNAKILKCIKNIGINFFKNYILIIYTILLIGYISIFIFSYLNKNKNNLSEKSTNHIKSQKSQKKIENPNIRNETTEGNERKDKTSNKMKVNNVNIRIIEKDQSSKERMEPKKKEKKYHEKIGKCRYSDSVHKLHEDSKNIKKEFINIFISSFEKRFLILKCKKDLDYYIIKIILLVYEIINIIVTNIFFFSEKNIHQIYIDKGKYNFGYQIKFIIISFLISYILLYLPKYIIINKGKIIFNKITNIFIFISIALFIFYWLYIGANTSTYINTKIHIVVNSIITLLFCCIIECSIGLISAILNYKSFKKLSNIINIL